MSTFMRLGLILSIIISVNSYAEEMSVQQICAGHIRKVRPLEYSEDLKIDVCEIRNFYPGEKSVGVVTQLVLEAIEKLEPSTKGNRKSKTEKDLKKFDSSLEDLSSTLNRLNSKKTPSNNLAKAIYALQDRFGSVRDRKDNPEQYVEAIKTVLSMTKAGKEGMGCFFKTVSYPHINREPIVEVVSDFEGGIGGKFLMDPDKNGNYDRKVQISSESPPLAALNYLAHEFKHSCDWKEELGLKRTFDDELKKVMFEMDLGSRSYFGYEHTPEFDKANQEINHEMVVDELRAYSTELRFFKEVAKAAPELFCPTAKVSIFYGKRVIKLGEMYSLNEELLNNGDFAYHLIDVYTRMQVIDGHAVYTKGALHPDLVKMLRSEGFKVRKVSDK